MNWESLIAERIAAHRDTYAPQRIEDAGKRNARRAQGMKYIPSKLERTDF